MRRTVGAGLALLALAGQAVPASAQETLPRFYVYGEDDGGKDLVACNVTHALAVGAVQSELRSAGATIQTDADDPEAVMDVYINIAPLPVSGRTTCAYALALAFESFNEASNPFTGSSEFSKLSYCNKGSVMIWERGTAQAEINTALRRHTRDCLAKYKGRNSR
jgi:hypothetical protein